MSFKVPSHPKPSSPAAIPSCPALPPCPAAAGLPRSRPCPAPACCCPGAEISFLMEEEGAGGFFLRFRSGLAAAAAAIDRLGSRSHRAPRALSPGLGGGCPQASPPPPPLPALRGRDAAASPRSNRDTQQPSRVPAPFAALASPGPWRWAGFIGGETVCQQQMRYRSAAG